MWSKFVESLNAGLFQYNSFIHLTQKVRIGVGRTLDQPTC